MKLHHIGIAAENMEDMTAYLEHTMQVKYIGEIIFDHLQDAFLRMVTLEDGSRIELISGNAVKSYLKKRIYLYHVCYEVDDVDKEKKKWLDNGAMLISDKKQAVLFENRNVVFLLTNMGMLELLERY